MNEVEISRRRRSVAERRTDLARWSDPASFPHYWDPRAKAASPLLAGLRWICDVGCGAQALRRYLEPGVTYMPADLSRRTPDTELCELNTGRLPRASLRRRDAAVLLGVVEYVIDPSTLFEELAELAEKVVLSYCSPELWSVDRDAFGWVNALDGAQLHAMLAQVGYSVRYQAVFEGRQHLILAQNCRFDQTSRIRRAVTRCLKRRV